MAQNAMLRNRLALWFGFLVLSAASLASGILFLLPTRERPSQSPVASPQASLSPATQRLTDFAPERSVPEPAISMDSPGAPSWEDRLEKIISAEGDDQAIVRQLLSGLQRLPGEAQQEFIAHALNLCEDENYIVVEAVYFSPGATKEVCEEIFNDALNRPDEIKLPLLAKTMGQSVHPMFGEAREILEMYLDIETGSLPPAGWEAAVQQYLAEDAK